MGALHDDPRELNGALSAVSGLTEHRHVWIEAVMDEPDEAEEAPPRRNLPGRASIPR
jgi:hypothetical protein